VRVPFYIYTLLWNFC